MPTIEPPKERGIRPQVLTQVGHEGNPVECFVVVDSNLDPDEPTLVMPRFPTGGSGGTPILPLSLGVGGGGLNCYSGGNCTTIAITGGIPPYTLETTNGVLTAITGSSYQLCANVNSGSAVLGDAYEWAARYCKNLGFTDCVKIVFGCNGQVVTPCTGAGSQACACPSESCSALPPADDCIRFTEDTTPIRCNSLPLAERCSGVISMHNQCDSRSAQMIADGCAPCAISFENGAIVTVTDSSGRMASIGVEQVFE